MNARYRLWLLSALGVSALACQASSSNEPAALQESAASDDAALSYYLGSLAYRALPVPLQRDVRAALDAAPGPATRASLIALVTTPRFFELVHADGPDACEWHGDRIAFLLVRWTKDVAAPRDDKRAAAAIDAAKQKLASVDVHDISAAAAALSAGRFAVPDCGDGTNNNNTYTTTTTYVMLAPQHEMANEAGTVLADLFLQADAVTPSRAMTSEWTSLKARFEAGMRKADRRASVELLRDARRLGSSTLARDAHAGRRFDEASRLVDAFARSGVAPSIDAMNLVHAALASENHGRIRTGGQDVSSGRGRDRLYLPGTGVTAATTQLFADIRARRANGHSAPQLAAVFDQRMISIHPYTDANGRTTRLMTDWLLLRDGFPPALASSDMPSRTLLWQKADVVRGASLDQITLGMRRTVELIEASA